MGVINNSISFRRAKQPPYKRVVFTKGLLENVQNRMLQVNDVFRYLYFEIYGALVSTIWIVTGQWSELC